MVTSFEWWLGMAAGDTRGNAWSAKEDLRLIEINPRLRQ